MLLAKMGRQKAAKRRVHRPLRMREKLLFIDMVKIFKFKPDGNLFFPGQAPNPQKPNT
jgi:hypothetical protein